MCFETDEEAKSYNECNDALCCTGCGLAVDQGFNKGGTLGAAPGVRACGVEPLPVGTGAAAFVGAHTIEYIKGGLRMGTWAR